MSFRINWDAIGITTSLACAVHCAVLPTILSTLPVFGINLVGNVAFEYLMILLALGIGAYSLWHGYWKHHHSLGPLIIFCIGILMLFAKQLWHSYQLWFLPMGVVLIITAHLMNYRSCQLRSHVHSGDCNH